MLHLVFHKYTQPAGLVFAGVGGKDCRCGGSVSPAWLGAAGRLNGRKGTRDVDAIIGAVAAVLADSVRSDLGRRGDGVCVTAMGTACSFALAAASGLKLQPFLVQQTQAAGRRDALGRDWPVPSAGIDKHRGYAFQWYALAALALIFYVITGFRRGSRTNR